MCRAAVYFLKLEEQRAGGRLCFSVDSGLESFGRTRRSDGIQRRFRKLWKSEAQNTEWNEQEKTTAVTAWMQHQLWRQQAGVKTKKGHWGPILHACPYTWALFYKCYEPTMC